MRALIQRTTGASVNVEGQTIGQIGSGLVILVGISHNDTENEVDFLAQKIINLRLFPSEKSEFDLSALDAKKELLIVSQFTLYGNCNKGRRPDFGDAAKPDMANELYKIFVQKMQATGLRVATGQFQTHMHVELVNDGPVTFMLES